LKSKNLDLTYEEFLQELQVTHENYIEIARSSLKKVKIFLKRKLLEVNIYNYNTDILNCFMSNMDIQFI
jgi:hypothetical protein